MATAKKALVIEAALQDGTDASRLAQSLVYDEGVDTPVLLYFTVIIQQK